MHAHIDFRPGLHFYNKRVIYESEFNKHVRMIYAQKHTHTCICVCVCVRMQMRKYVALYISKWHLCVPKHTYIIN